MYLTGPSAFLIANFYFRQCKYQFDIAENLWFCYMSCLQIFPSLLRVEEVISFSANNLYIDIKVFGQ
jgi:hypothetical protein